MKLDVHFSGLCAFVPNTLIAGPPATTWSVLLVNLEDRFNLDERTIAPHFAVLRYRLDHFDASRDPDLVINPGTSPEGVFRLRGKRVELDLPGAKPFSSRPW